MKPLSWPFGAATEYALAFDRSRERRLLIVPALFDEANKLRRLTVEIMRRLDAAGVDSVLPDLPGTNESLRPMQAQTCGIWREAMNEMARQFGATHALGMRGGCLFTPDALPGWHYAPTRGANVLRQMIRARSLASREAGVEESTADLLAMARSEGVVLAGYALGAQFCREFSVLDTTPAKEIAQGAIGGGGLWLRAEPADSPAQADELAAQLTREIAA